MRILPLVLTTIFLSSAMALPLSDDHMQSSSTPLPSVSSGWTIEIVGVHGGSAPPYIALDSADQPRIHFCPPGEDRYAFKDEGNWTNELIALTVGGGVCGPMDTGPDDAPYLVMAIPPEWDPSHFYLAAKIKDSWRFIERSREVGDIVVDSVGVPHTTGIIRSSPGYWSVVYRTFAAGAWQTEVVETFAYSGSTISFSWGSLALDSTNRPHILHYDSARGEVRHVYRQDDGTWSVEVVENIGNIGYIGNHGSLAIDENAIVHAAYLSSVSWKENRATLRHGVRDSSGWSIETVDGPPGMKGFSPTMLLSPEGLPRIGFQNWGKMGADLDLRYATYNGSSWSFETAYDAPLLGVQFPQFALDSCGNPHVAFFSNDDGGVMYATKGNCTSNRPPTANAGGPYVGHEGTPLTLTATATDPDNDPLKFRWDFDNDGIADTSWSSSPTATHTWSDDHSGLVRVEVSDNKTTANATATVTILNIPPRIDSFIVPAINATATLRIAGEKWHNVSAYVVDGGSQTLIATLTRQPGKPQEPSFPVTIDPMKGKSIRVVYTPDDDKVNGNRNGANPAWLTFTFDGGGEETFHHTFNVKHEDTWNWTVGLNQLLAGREVRFTAAATDPGSDDLTFTWEWGDGTTATISSYPNGGTFPFTATDEETHVYTLAGTYDLKMTVSDDDGGWKEFVIALTLT